MNIGYGESNMADPVPFPPGRMIRFLLQSLPKAKLDRGSIPFEAGEITGQP